MAEYGIRYFIVMTSISNTKFGAKFKSRQSANKFYKEVWQGEDGGGMFKDDVGMMFNLRNMVGISPVQEIEENDN